MCDSVISNKDHSLHVSKSVVIKCFSKLKHLLSIPVPYYIDLLDYVDPVRIVLSSALI